MKRYLIALLGLLFGSNAAMADESNTVYQLSQAESSTGSQDWLKARDVDEQVCMTAVIRATGNADVVVQKWESMRGKTAILLGVDEEREPWRCIVYKGHVEEVRRHQ